MFKLRDRWHREPVRLINSKWQNGELYSYTGQLNIWQEWLPYKDNGFGSRQAAAFLIKIMWYRPTVQQQHSSYYSVARTMLWNIISVSLSFKYFNWTCKKKCVWKKLCLLTSIRPFVVQMNFRLLPHGFRFQATAVWSTAPHFCARVQYQHNGW